MKCVDDNVIQTSPAEGGNGKIEDARIQRIQVKMSIDNSTNGGHLIWIRGLPSNA